MYDLEILNMGHVDYGKSNTSGVQIFSHGFFIDNDVFTPNLDEQDIRKTQLLNWSSKLPLEQKMLFFRTEKRVNFSIYSYLFCY